MAQAIHINDIELFNLSKGKLGDKEVEGLVQYVKTSAVEELKRNVDSLASRKFYWTGTVIALLGGMFAFIKFFLK